MTKYKTVTMSLELALLKEASEWIKANSFGGTDAIDLWERIDARLESVNGVTTDEYLIEIAKQSAAVCSEQHSYMDRALYLDWQPHKWVIDAMRKVAAPVVERQESDIEIAARLVEGKTVSVDVSTGDQDAGNRLFCTIVEVMEDGDSFTLLAVDPEPNFEASPPAPVAVVLPARRDTPEYWNPYQNPSAERACGWNGYDDELKRLNPGLFAKVKD